ncbi:hypothetical protein M3699_14340 [Peribacillus simplex]|uniref:hypothetical protein n=1 Tax=Peribacillus simplex TaxID=1478 RepID=UPI00203DEA01|nr:hypothetical protein [Peribacillus simplex]MCM3675033.1 hypothetical protein [Peribacillus simplex]
MKEAGCTEFYIEKLSGATMVSPELQRMLEELEEGDLVIIHEIVANNYFEGNIDNEFIFRRFDEFAILYRYC